jgi:hypothetical protein
MGTKLHEGSLCADIYIDMPISRIGVNIIFKMPKGQGKAIREVMIHGSVLLSLHKLLSFTVAN